MIGSGESNERPPWLPFRTLRPHYFATLLDAHSPDTDRSSVDWGEEAKAVDEFSQYLEWHDVTPSGVRKVRQSV